MKSNLNIIRQKCSWPNLQQTYIRQVWDLLAKRCYFKFQDEIQFYSNKMAIMEQLKYRDSESFCDCIILLRLC